MAEGEIVNNKYKLEAVLGSGGFGKVFQVTSIEKKKQYALKLDLKRKGHILTEAKILEDIQRGPGIPKLYDRGKTEDFSYMVITLLGDNLNTMVKNCGGRFTLGTVANVGSQLLDRVEFLHNKDYIHRDIKPQQFILDQANTMIYLVDYGLAKKFIIAKNHIPFQTHCSRVGNSTFSSLNNHMGIRQSRRDDLESISYMLIYMLKGKLPWQQKSKNNSFLKWQKVFISKASITIQDLCRDFPPEFSAFMDYCRIIKFEEKPDYNYLRGLLAAVSKRSNLVNLFDWSVSPSVIEEAQDLESGKKIEDSANKTVSFIQKQEEKSSLQPFKKPINQRSSKRSKTGKTEKSKYIFKPKTQQQKFEAVVDLTAPDFLPTELKGRPRALSQKFQTPSSRLKPPQSGSTNTSNEDKTKIEVISSYHEAHISSSIASSLILDLPEDEESCYNSEKLYQGIRKNLFLTQGSTKKIHFSNVENCDAFESYNEPQLRAVSLHSKPYNDDTYDLYSRNKFNLSVNVNSIVPIIDEAELTPKSKKLPEIRNRAILWKKPFSISSSAYQKTLSKHSVAKVLASDEKCAIF